MLYIYIFIYVYIYICVIYIYIYIHTHIYMLCCDFVLRICVLLCPAFDLVLQVFVRLLLMNNNEGM